jgi:prepilin signal peptidase PulO-like enzyme (type II secretory pathway)
VPFALSIAVLSLAQAVLIAVPARPPRGMLGWARSRWWAIAPPASIAVVIAVIAAVPDFAGALTYVALVGVPALAALALAGLARGGRPALALAVVPVFALAWAAGDTLVGEASALALSALAAVALGSLLAAVVPSDWLRLGIYAMAVVDAALVGADLLQHPNSVLAHAAPAAGLPSLQSVAFGSAAMGFGDLFVAAAVGALLAAEGRPCREAVAIAAALGLAFDLLFTVVNELPATVPIALTLAVLEVRRHRATRQRSELGAPAASLAPQRAATPP